MAKALDAADAIVAEAKPKAAKPKAAPKPKAEPKPKPTAAEAVAEFGPAAKLTAATRKLVKEYGAAARWPSKNRASGTTVAFLDNRKGEIDEKAAPWLIADLDRRLDRPGAEYDDRDDPPRTGAALVPRLRRGRRGEGRRGVRREGREEGGREGGREGEGRADVRRDRAGRGRRRRRARRLTPKEAAMKIDELTVGQMVVLPSDEHGRVSRLDREEIVYVEVATAAGIDEIDMDPAEIRPRD